MKNLVYIVFLFALLSCGENKSSHKETTNDSEKGKTETTSAGISKKILSNALLSYSIIKTRQIKSLKNDSLENVINTWLEQNENANINDLVDFNLELTKNQLNFIFDKCSSDLSTIIKTHKANCIGYSALFNSLMNYTLTKKQLHKRYKCLHYVGKIYYAGQNINDLFNDPFFKDHDFNMVKDKENKNNIVVDPSLYEYLGIKRICIKK
jgi:hypothetical protein